MDALRDQGLLDDTLVVITADHAAQTGRRFHGRLDTFTVGTNINACDPATPTSPSALRSDCNWYYGQESGPLADEAYLDPSPAIRQLRDALTLAERRDQPALLLPGRPHRGLAERHLDGQEAGGGAGDPRPAGRDRELQALRRR